MSSLDDIPKERWRGPPEGPPEWIPPPGRGCSSVFMMIVGAILLLPGLCSLIYGLDLIHFYSGPYFSWFMAGMVSGALGILLIRMAWRRPKPPDTST
jgi:hypothetical protein